MAEDSGVSQSTRIVLVFAGASAVVVVLLILYGLFSFTKGAAAAFLALLPKKTRPKTSKKAKAAKGSDSEQEVVHAGSGKDRGPDLKSLIKQQQQAAKKKGVPKDELAASHELFINTLKDHADAVHAVAWSRDGQLLASACEDMQVRIFDLSDLANKNPKFRRVKTSKIPTGVGFGDAADEVVVAMRGVSDTIVALYRPTVKVAGAAPQFDAAWTVEQVHGREPCLALQSVPTAGAAIPTGIVVSLSTKKEGRVFDLKGRPVATFEPASLANHGLALSLDGRFMAVASFSPDVKIWEMKYGREGEFKGLQKAMILSHKSQVTAVAISQDNRRAATCSKDGMLKVWNIDVRFHLSEDPKVLLSVPMALPDGRAYQHLAFGPPATGLLAACHEGTVHLLSAATGELLERIDAHDLTISCIRWAPAARKGEGGRPVWAFATASRDKRVRIWRAPAADADA